MVLRDAAGVEHFARVKIPDTLPQLVPVTAAPKSKSRTKVVVKEQVFVWLEQLVTANLGALFPGMTIVEAHPFHVTRDADSEIQDLEAGDLLESVEEGVWQRRFADVVRVEINEAMPPSVLEILVTNLELDRDDIYKIPWPAFAGAGARPRQVRPSRPEVSRRLSRLFRRPCSRKTRKRTSSPPSAVAIFCCNSPSTPSSRSSGCCRRPRNDPNVLAIKITLYRVGRNAPVVDALLEAAENGKQVAVLLELKARFDEESNIGWARKLEEYGVHVVYGLLGLKVHCKVALIVRKEGDVIRRYAHLATGNYNSRHRAALYRYRHVDLRSRDWRRLHRPVQLPDRIFREGLLSQAAGRSATASQPHRGADRSARSSTRKPAVAGTSSLKMNALVDRKMIQLLYQASQAGVKVDLLVRGICCLRAGRSGRQRQHSGHQHRRALPRAQPHLLLPQWR